jgi:CBS domain-containing protein
MYTEYLVADFMTIDPIFTSPDARLEDAERLLEAYGISGLPVVEEDGRLVGVISQTDLLRGGGEIRGAARMRSTGLRVGEVMTSPATTVNVATPLCEAARLMRDEKIHRVVAVNDSGTPVGVLSSMDFVSLYAEG